MTLAVAAAGMLLLPALALGGRGTLVAKDSGTGNSPVAVAQATIQNPGTVKIVISTKPRHKKVQWSYTNRCTKGGNFYQYPGPGDHTTHTNRSKIKRTVIMPVSDPDECDVAVAGKLDYEGGKRVTAKIFNSP